MSPANPTASLSEQLADQIRARLAEGRLRPGQRLSEVALAAELGASRNSLREAFRLLCREGLLTHAANRGVSVSVLSEGQIIDIYRVRRLIEGEALRQSWPDHPAVATMAAAVAEATACAAANDWPGVAAANLAFHAAIVDCADSPRLSALHHRLSAELGLAFARLPNPQSMHLPYIAQNREILALVEANDSAAAAEKLAQYLRQSERAVLAAHVTSGAEA
ncbi:GntR family transcriptional regulator [Paracoccus aminophilus]|uniref:Transcriptional regulator, GntR family n=1 Tax=Paracoccus aminophilus JCM 7686 TaxID=1367847 RepID=S5YH32_PARAH|nr:GntR family transcriptional regulator [Paracoccus aminophilus]AGT10778.1 transcriptional regulator, GntR family [Paracoccus aminophilus JCM 7686]